MSAGDNPGGGRIVVTTAARLTVFEMVIADNGPGISAENLARVFEPLFSTKSFGTGLGLPTVRRIVEMHGGTIDVESVVDQGTTLTLWMPRQAQTATAPASTEAAA